MDLSRISGFAVLALLGFLAIPGLPGVDVDPWPWFNFEVRDLGLRLADLDRSLVGLPVVERPRFSERSGYHGGFSSTPSTNRVVSVDLGRIWELDAVALVPAFSPTAGDEAYGFPKRFRIETAVTADDPAPLILVDHTTTDYRAGRAPIFCRRPGLLARYLRVVPTQLSPMPGDPHQWLFCLGEVLAFADGCEIARAASVTVSVSHDSHPVWGPQFITDGNAALGLPITLESPSFNGWCSVPASAADQGGQWIQLDLGRSLPLDEVRLIPMHHPGFPDRAAYGFPHHFTISLADDAEFSRGLRTIYRSPEEYAGPGDNPLPINLHRKNSETTGRFLRITATSLHKSSGRFVFAVAEVEVYSGGRNVARQAPVTTSDMAQEPGWTRESLTDGRVTDGPLRDWADWLEDLARRHDLEQVRSEIAVQRNVAVGIAQHRAGWATVAVLLMLMVVAVGFWWRSRVLRERALAELRDRIARDLHDEIGSHLGSIMLMSEMAQRPGADATSALAEIQRLSREAGTSMRGIIWLVREGERPTLHRLAEAMRQAADHLLGGIVCRFPIPADDGRQAALDFHRQVYLFFREAAHNVVRHARSESVDVSLTWDQRRLVLMIEDHGQGFDPDTITPGSGLANLRHRATVIGGTMTLTSIPGYGTRITLEVPLS